MSRVGRILTSPVAVAIMSALPVPLALVRRFLQADNARENARDGWSRLRADTERARYCAVSELTEQYAEHGFVLDIGCSQGILQESLRYGRYLGVDAYAPVIEGASSKSDDRTAFVCADASTFCPDAPPDAVVFNEVVYYLNNPLETIAHHAAELASDGVVIISVFARAWSTRRLLAALGRRMTVLEQRTISSGHLAWTVAAYRPRTAKG